MRILPQSAQNRPMPERTHPQFRYPSQRHLLPSHCTGCGLRLLLGEVPTGSEPVVDATCLYCARTACELIADSARRPLTPAEWAALPVEQGKRGSKGAL